MSACKGPVLAINPGSTSTKIGVFRPGQEPSVSSISHSDEELSYFDGIIDQLQFRTEKVRDCLQTMGIDVSSLAAVAGRGGLLAPLASGTYLVDEKMMEDLRKEARGSHASNLGALIAHNIAAEAGCPAYIVDPVSVDELEPVARYSGCALFERTSLSHALNTKAVAKRFARERGRRYSDLRLVVAHLGSGVSVSAHAGGRMVDVNNSREEGPFAPDRSGTVPAMALLDMCYSGRFEKKELAGRIFKRGGVASYLDTTDMRKVGEMIEQGDRKATEVVEAMVYQVRKEIGAQVAVLEGRLDALVITGGMAHNKHVMDRLLPAVQWVGEVVVYPGEDELQALYEGALRVLSGEEEVLRY